MNPKHAKAAMLSKSAVNVSALFLSAADQMSAIWDEARALGKGTDYVNKHPYVVMLVTQLVHLAGLGIVDTTVYGQAYAACTDALNVNAPVVAPVVAQGYCEGCDHFQQASIEPSEDKCWNCESSNIKARRRNPRLDEDTPA